MPLHEYLCQECDARFEAITTSAKADSVACPMCHAVETRRLISVIAGVGRGSSPGAGREFPAGPTGGGCCGGSCGCH